MVFGNLSYEYQVGLIFLSSQNPEYYDRLIFQSVNRVHDVYCGMFLSCLQICAVNLTFLTDHKA